MTHASLCTLSVVLCVLHTVDCMVNVCKIRNYDIINDEYNNALENTKTLYIDYTIELISLGEASTVTASTNEINARYIKVVSLTPWEGYKNAIGKTLTTDRSVWVTTYAEMIRKCASSCTESDFDLRMKQLLGLHPNTTITYAVEMSVPLENLFRPCYSPETHTKACPMEYPKGVDGDHVRWIEDLKKISYLPYTGYPWTRLGYTYDWSGGKTKYGLSEFVIKPGSNIIVESVSDTYNLCCGPP